MNYIFIDLLNDLNVMPVDNLTIFDKSFSRGDNAIYVINKKNIYAQNLIERYGKASFFKRKGILLVDGYKLNFFNKLIFLSADAVFDSFQGILKLGISKILKKFLVRRIYTQHGINVFKSGFLAYDAITEQHYDYVVTSNQYEFDFFRTFYSYKTEQLIKGGLPRLDKFDLQNNMNKKNVLVYFTYRNYLYSKTYLNEYSKRLEEIFLFFKQNYNHCYNLFFVKHHEIKFEKNSDGISKNIQFVSENILPNLKDKCDILITDFSSMAFDFLYLKKKVFFYIIDYNLLEKSIPKIDNNGIKYALNILNKDFVFYYKISDFMNLESKLFSSESLKKEYVPFCVNNRTNVILNFVDNHKKCFNKINYCKINLPEIYSPALETVYELNKIDIPFKLYGCSGAEDCGRWFVNDFKCGFVFFNNACADEIVLYFDLYKAEKRTIFIKLNNHQIKMSDDVNSQAVEISKYYNKNVNIEFYSRVRLCPDKEIDNRKLLVFLKKIKLNKF